MARRTKADAQATRASLLDAAERLFQARGVARTSLGDIAAEAGATRGAIYWNFKDKGDLFNAMMERVTLPLEQSVTQGELDSAADPVAVIREGILKALAKIEGDEQVWRVLQIATHRVEVTPELSAEQQRRLAMHAQSLARIRSGLARAYALRAAAPPVPLTAAALGLQVLVEGLLNQWLLSPGTFALVTTARSTLTVYLRGLQLIPLSTPDETR